MTSRRRDRRAWTATVALVVAAVVVALAPHLSVGSSRATLTTSASATGNVATAGTCTTSSRSWASNSNGGLLDTNVVSTAARRSWNRFGGASALSADAWMTSRTWTATTSGNAPSYGASGALYCDSDPGVGLTTASSYVTTSSVGQSTFGMNSTTTNLVLMLWFKTSTTSDSSLASVSDGSSIDRVLWIDSTGHLRFSGRSGNTGSSWTTAATGRVVNDGGWHFVVAVMTPYNATNGGVALYLDGASLLTDTSHATPFRSFGSNVRWSVGDTRITTGGPAGAPTTGTVGSYDEFVLASTSSLTAGQIMTLYLAADQ